MIFILFMLLDLRNNFCKKIIKLELIDRKKRTSLYATTVDGSKTVFMLIIFYKYFMNVAVGLLRCRLDVKCDT